MRFAWKVFFSTITVVTLAFGIGGTMLISALFQSSLDKEIVMAIQENRYLCFSFQTAVRSLSENQEFNPKSFLRQIDSVVDPRNSDMAIVNRSEVRFSDGPEFAASIAPGKRAVRIVSGNDGTKYVQAVSYIRLSSDDYYLESVSNISSIYTMRQTYVTLYQGILLAVICISSLILLVLTHFLTRPLKQLSITSQKIASGDFSNRAKNRGFGENDEVGMLTRNFNTMADVVEEKIHDLEETARQREDFVASFAHELKTPLTSIIGYADMLRSYDMDASDRFTAANYIFSEGKRLEALSLHLLDLIVLRKQDFPTEMVNCLTFMQECVCILKPLLEKYHQELHTELQPATVMVVPSLLKTMIYNLIDNACKASERNGNIVLKGFISKGRYQICICDHGRGIPPEELSKITEPFYMVDKSRSRSQNGAGLGLTLCQEIALLHGSELKIESQLQKGTTISFTVELVEKDKMEGLQKEGKSRENQSEV